MDSTNLSIRIDKDTKEKANELFSELGISMSTAINIFLKTAIREQAIPFDIKLHPNRETLEAMIEADIIANDNSRKRYSSIEELRKALEV